ncbi:MULTISPECIES: UDP-N-acetylmuramoyl-tripeptide--D-alanyl-D-alanine ligase [unclassified Ruminococcus]|uniref:UDP-N-acetylmuramoyl-tripeptide--D-alanyl-D- alanine ligase n=1 Tax=unclassified Ruminococcus TaxID=2608920 RepID=UPI00210DE840|nr:MULTISPECIES: UDP-N-acetylmuramoyl-tripeptide--D-alanyl-D-alanine ligase [unclassified Ruminococcus]MCQ4022287.1 UDP-N-acetylmuramoyl-tripeptide--D-alanyl-D-alanine ligase [Ruminococcus sp. zg-924]MCQ4114615.1 UDP-N-acetylmuramoyl-tripeptide--D-alanyl-D-alanine ligase [Ruminococcus sp. zg-921]
MNTFTINDILSSCGGRYVGDESLKQTEVSTIVTDSRKVTNGACFAAIKGERSDGHAYIEQCFDNGAVCAICEDEPENPSKPCIVVKSTLVALKQAAEYYRSQFDIPVIGITGSVGKTSTKEMVAAVLSQKFNVHKTQGNFNNELGVPITLFGLNESHTAAVVEMGISDFGEMTRLAKMVRPTHCIITNIGNCHLENLRDRDGVLAAKTEVFDYMTGNREIFLNGDDDKLATQKDREGIDPVYFGINTSNEYYAEDVQNNGADGVSCTLVHGERKISVHIDAIGTYMVSNALAAFAVGESLGMTDEEIAKGVAGYKTVGSRDNLIKTGRINIIDDCYNANPNSVMGAIDTLMNFKGRRVCILGDMKELGENELELHKKVGKYAKEKGVELLAAVGPLAEKIKDGFGEGALWYNTVEELVESLDGIIKDGDSILVKASRAMKLERVVDALKNKFMRLK